MSAKRLLVLIQGHEVAASRYRILQFLPYLQEHGWKCDVMAFPDSVREYRELNRALPAYDTVFVQRKRFHFPFLQLFGRRAPRVVFDLDDAVMYKNSLADSPYSKTRMRRFAAMMKRVDAVVAGNSFLREETLPFHDEVIVVPTSIPAHRYSMKDYDATTPPVTIGWIGDHGSIHYLERMKPVWEELGRRYPGQVELKIICDVFLDCEHIPVRKVQWSSETEVEELKSMDVGVMPLMDDLWSRGKCGLKILQYFGVGVPAVCTPVGMNRDVVHHGENGFWATTEEEWLEHLSCLVEDASLRRRFGLEARHTLEQGYTVEANAPRLLEIIEG